MGCCEHRDEANKVVLRRRRDRTKSLSIDLGIEITDSDLPTPFPTPGEGTISNETNEVQDENEQKLVNYVQTCNMKKKWDSLAPLISNKTPITDPKINLPWTDKPKTLGCLALVYLGIAVKKYNSQVAPYIEVFLPVVLAHLKSGTSDLKENSIILLYYYIDYATEKAVNKILQLEVFLYLNKWILGFKEDLRKLTINLCYKIYKGRDIAKNEFIEANGGFYLFQMIGWYGDSDYLDELITCLEEIIVFNDGSLNKEIVVKTKEPLSLDILNNIHTNDRTHEIQQRIENIVGIYKKDYAFNVVLNY